MTLISYLNYCSICHILALSREFVFGGDLFQNVWVASLELARDMPQLVLQVHNGILAVSFSRRKELKVTDHLLCASSSLDFHLCFIITLYAR